MTPIGQRRFPENDDEYQLFFASEAACRQYVQRLRWPDGFRCYECGLHEAWHTARGHFRCSGCQRQISLTSGTILEGTRKPLSQWIKAIWYVTGRKSGMSAMGLQKELNLGSYQTAWIWLRKLRQAMVNPDLKLQGTVDAGQADPGKWFRLRKNDPARPRIRNILAVAVEATREQSREGMGRIALKLLRSDSPVEFTRFLEQSLAIGARVRVGGANDYVPMEDVLTTPELMGHASDPTASLRVNSIASHLRRWLGRTYCNSVDLKYFDYYLDEFAFRVNHRLESTRGKLFYVLLTQSLRSVPTRASSTRIHAAEQVAVATRGSYAQTAS